jgi:hypothetical protein
MIPEEKLGVVLLVNLQGSSLHTALAYRVFDAYLNQPQKDWSAELLKTAKASAARAKEAEKKRIEARAKDTKPSLPLEKYAGAYQNEMYGEAKVALENGALTVRYGTTFNGKLEHWHYDTFQAKWSNILIGKGLVNFTLDAQGKVAEMKVENLAEFKRAPDKAEAVAGVTLSEADLKKFAGKYAAEALPIEVSIEVVGGKLKAVVPGQPVYTLIPVAPARFQIEAAPAGFFVQFELTGGEVKSLKLEQGSAPSLTLLPKRT